MRRGHDGSTSMEAIHPEFKAEAVRPRLATIYGGSD